MNFLFVEAGQFVSLNGGRDSFVSEFMGRAWVLMMTASSMMVSPVPSLAFLPCFLGLSFGESISAYLSRVPSLDGVLGGSCCCPAFWPSFLAGPVCWVVGVTRWWLVCWVSVEASCLGLCLS